MTKESTIPDHVFCLNDGGEPVWKAIMDGQVLPIEWNSKGAAQAGLKVEQDRKEKKNSTSQAV
jgi:hypothetical protein